MATTTHGRIMRCKLAAKPGQIESNIDLPYQMIFRDRVAQMKLVEQLTLVTLQTAHHGSTSPRFASMQRNHASRPVSTTFAKSAQAGRNCRFDQCRVLLRVSDAGQRQRRDIHQWSASESRQGKNPRGMGRGECRALRYGDLADAEGASAGVPCASRRLAGSDSSGL